MRRPVFLPILIALAAALAVGTLHFVRGSREGPEAAEWHRVRTGTLIRVDAERALYEVEGEEHFFVRLLVTNLHSEPLGVDIADYWEVIRPNQWGGIAEPRRGEINEERTMPAAPDAARWTRLRDDFVAGRLLRIPAGGARDVYVEFNASGRAEVDGAASGFVFVSLDGLLYATSGAGSEQLTLEAGAGADPGDLDSDLILARPIQWGRAPDGAVVIRSP